MPSIRGVLPALVTPLDAAGRLDRAGLDRLLDHVLAAPLAGIAPGGSTGEGPLLSPEQRVELAGAVRARLTADQWLVPGVPAPTATAALGEIEALAGAGASAVLLPPPWYYPLGPAEVVRYFTAVADAAALPLVLYNIPRFTKVSLDPEVVAELAGHPRIVGTKDSSGDLEHLTRTTRLTAATDDFSVLTGTDGSFLDALTAGG
ncbi:MAG TPA: dihydrodipicolinate synthase family protein, partial [Acidimicrobiales bacterium]|nr:dihydrodipicolinate synthase family protein [Acidimicrobiales bacterium]